MLARSRSLLGQYAMIPVTSSAIIPVASSATTTVPRIVRRSRRLLLLGDALGSSGTFNKLSSRFSLISPSTKLASTARYSSRSTSHFAHARAARFGDLERLAPRAFVPLLVVAKRLESGRPTLRRRFHALRCSSSTFSMFALHGTFASRSPHRAELRGQLTRNGTVPK